jgi:hypothetical protein
MSIIKQKNEFKTIFNKYKKTYKLISHLTMKCQWLLSFANKVCKSRNLF